MFSGEGEIRTHGELAPADVFKTSALGHYATSPSLKILTNIGLIYQFERISHPLRLRKKTSTVVKSAIMPTQESRAGLPFPLTEHEFSYLKQFAAGETPTTLASTGTNLRAVNRVSVIIRRKLAARTLAQGIWKAWDAGLDISGSATIDKVSYRPLVESLPKTAQDILQMLAGGFHALETDKTTECSSITRQRIILGMYSDFSAKTHSELVHRAIQVGFFDDHKPIVFSKNKKNELRPDDRLLGDQQKMLHLIAQGMSYAEIASNLSSAKEGGVISLFGVRSRVEGLRAKMARLSGLPTAPSYQTIIRAVDLGLFDLSGYLISHNLEPSALKTLPGIEQKELEEAYSRVLTSGEWIGAGSSQSGKARTLRRIYRGIGAKNPMQATLMIHALKKRERDTNIGQGLMISVTSGVVFMVTSHELGVANMLDTDSLKSLALSLRDTGRTSTYEDKSGGRIITLLARILRGNMTSSHTEDLTYAELKSSYEFVGNVLSQNPNIRNAGALLRFVDQRLRKLRENIQTI